jgi:hypothetical protein
MEGQAAPRDGWRARDLLPCSTCFAVLLRGVRAKGEGEEDVWRRDLPERVGIQYVRAGKWRGQSSKLKMTPLPASHRERRAAPHDGAPLDRLTATF